MQAETIRALGLSPVLRKRVVALSKGYGRRLMLALALLTPHSLLLMDEPFDGAISAGLRSAGRRR